MRCLNITFVCLCGVLCSVQFSWPDEMRGQPSHYMSMCVRYLELLSTSDLAVTCYQASIPLNTDYIEEIARS